MGVVSDSTYSEKKPGLYGDEDVYDYDVLVQCVKEMSGTLRQQSSRIVNKYLSPLSSHSLTSS